MSFDNKELAEQLKTFPYDMTFLDKSEEPKVMDVDFANVDDCIKLARTLGDKAVVYKNPESQEYDVGHIDEVQNHDWIVWSSESSVPADNRVMIIKEYGWTRPSLRISSALAALASLSLAGASRMQLPRMHHQNLYDYISDNKPRSQVHINPDRMGKCTGNSGRAKRRNRHRN